MAKLDEQSSSSTTRDVRIGTSQRKIPSTLVLPTGSFLINNTARIQKYPDIVHLRLIINDLYLATSPSIIQEILVTKQRDFIKGEYLQNTRKVFGDGLLTSEGDYHHRQRRLIQPAFHHERIRSYAEIITQSEERLTKRWRDGDILDVHDEMTGLTMSIITRCLFNKDIESESKSISDDLTIVIEYFNRLSSPLSKILEMLPGNRKYVEAAERVDSMVYGIIKERRSSSARDRGDLMSMLLNAKDEDGSAMTDSQIRDEVLITFAAGHETTANALTWTWYLLSENPSSQERLLSEVDNVLRGRPPTAEDVPKLEYTTRVLSESMRLYPPAWLLPREAVNECIVGEGYTIPKGATVIVSQYLTHRDPRFFSNPEKFDPDRWTPEMRSKLPKFAYFPFGGGARSCVGEPLAWMEGVLLLAGISSNWKMRHDPKHQVELLPRITLRPKNGMRMVLQRR